MENVFLDSDNTPNLWDYLFNIEEGRRNLGEEMPVVVYRMFEYSMRDVLIEKYGKEKMIEIIRSAGEKTGREFFARCLDGSLPLNDYLAQVQQKLIEYKIGILRIESFDEETGRAILTVSEDLDCSGFPMIGETVCNYDEGFIAGLLKAYTGKEYVAIEIDCWGTGDRVCRFDAHIVAEK